MVVTVVKEAASVAEAKTCTDRETATLLPLTGRKEEAATCVQPGPTEKERKRRMVLLNMQARGTGQCFLVYLS